MDVTQGGGPRFIVAPMPAMRTVAIGVFVRSGSRDQDPGEGGVAHLVEHLLFKGSAHRGARALAEAMDALGGQFNAYTTREFTCFHALTLNEGLAGALELLAEIVTSPALDPEDFVRERAVVLDELRLCADDPRERQADDFGWALWGQHPVGRPEAGTAGEVAAQTSAGIVAFYHRHYRPDNVVIAIAGGVELGTALALAERAFATWRPQGATPAVARVKPRPQPRAYQRRWPGQQCYLSFGTVGPSLFDDQRWAASLLVSILGGAQSSRLFQSLRESSGLCYDVGAYDAAFTDAGEIAISLATSPDQAERATALAIEAVADITRNGVSPAELDRHRNLALQEIWMAEESTEAQMSLLGRSATCGQPLLEPSEMAARIQAVGPDDVQAACLALGDPATWAAASLGPRRSALGPWGWLAPPDA